MFSRIMVARPFLLIGAALIGALMLAAPRPTAAQSCALCYTQAASSGKRMIQGLKSGILVLVVPPMFMSAGITFLAYRKRNQSGRKPASMPSTNGW